MFGIASLSEKLRPHFGRTIVDVVRAIGSSLVVIGDG